MLFLTMVINQVATLWEGVERPVKTLSGSDGFPIYYHAWLIFDYRAQLFSYLTMVMLALKFPLYDKPKRIAIYSIILYVGITLIEVFRYLYWGNNKLNEDYFYYYLSAFTLGCIILYYTEYGRTNC